MLNVELEASPLMLEFIPLLPINRCLNFLMKQLVPILLYAFKYFNYLLQKKKKVSFEICGNIIVSTFRFEKEGATCQKLSNVIPAEGPEFKSRMGLVCFC